MRENRSVKQFLLMQQWGWKSSGVALGLSFILAIALVKPIGVSTQFVIFNGILWDTISPTLVQLDETSKTGYASTNSYLNKSGGAYAKSVGKPVNYGMVFVLAMFLGGFVGSRITTANPAHHNAKSSLNNKMPTVWQQRFGDSVAKRYLAVFIGGFLVLFGARLAGGCTSGHMMSGTMQTAVSGYLFTLGAFIVAIPLAMFMYNKGER